MFANFSNVCFVSEDYTLSTDHGCIAGDKDFDIWLIFSEVVFQGLEVLVSCFEVTAVVNDSDNIGRSLDAAVEIGNESFTDGVASDQNNFSGRVNQV